MRRSEGKEGVAIIIVLGLLGLLMVLGVAFSVSMRVERAGAANYASLAKNQQLVWAGLARAISDIHESLGTDTFPPGDFLASGSGGWGAVPGGGIRLLGGSATNFLPDLFLELGYQEHPAGWISMGIGEGRQGYAAYMVLNLSDMLDLMHVGGETRAGGTNAMELVLDDIGVDGDALRGVRELDGPFETLDEFKSLYPDISAGYLSAYSRYLPDSNRVEAVAIGGSVSELEANRADIVAAIRRMAESGGQGSLSEASADAVFENLLDYIDEDSIPHALDGPYTEAVPMVNEVAPMQAAIVPQGGAFVFGANVGLETWYPFVAPSAESFTLTCEYDVTGSVTEEVSGVVSTNSAVSMGLPALASEPINDFPFDVIQQSIGADFPITPGSSNHTFDVTVTISNVVVEIGSDMVDSTGDAVFRFSYAGGGGNPIVMDPVSYQTIDPRFNWEQTYWFSQAELFGVTNQASLSQPDRTNVWTKAFLAQRTTDTPARPSIELGADMHVSNRGRMSSPLEWGHVLRSDSPTAMFQTFRVLEQRHGSQPGSVAQRHEMLENFTVADDPASAKRGLVNPNTLHSDILATAFRDMPHPYVGGPELDTAVVGAVTNLVATARADGTVFNQLADLLDDLDWRSAPELASLTDTELESLLSYSSGLLGVRQNLFLIAVAAASGSEGMGEQAQGQIGYRGRQRAIALVWRDPVPNAEGLHDCFVRMFKWLD